MMAQGRPGVKQKQVFFLINSSIKRFKKFSWKTCILDCRTTRKRDRIASSLIGEGNRIVRSFGGKGIRMLVLLVDVGEGKKNTCRCKGKGIESSSSCVINLLRKIS